MTPEEKAEFKQEIRDDIKEAVHDNLGAYKVPKEQHYKDHLFISEIDKERFSQHQDFIESWIKWTDRVSNVAISTLIKGAVLFILGLLALGFAIFGFKK